MFGTLNCKSLNCEICLVFRSFPESAVIAMGTVWMSSAFFSAVTITVSICAKAGVVSAVDTRSALMMAAERMVLMERTTVIIAPRYDLVFLTIPN